MNKQEYPKIKEVIYSETLANGLNVFLLVKKGYHKSYVNFSTNLGSLSTKIQKNNGEILELPKGIAHFLEHKLFEQNGKDVSSLFAENQARVNAFTQNNRTSYIFSCTANLIKNIELLLDFVQNPLFTVEGVEKEKGIINQEIKMYQDDPGTVTYMKLLRNLYETHPVKYDILGTEESIKEIDIDILNKTHQTFYSPENMILFITGDFDPTELMNFIIENQASITFNSSYIPINELLDTNQFVFKKESSIDLEITIPNYLLGIKLLPTNFKEENMMKKELIMAILIDLVLGKSSANYRQLIEDELINDSFGIDITFEETYGYFLVGSETFYPEKLNSIISSIFQNLNFFKVNKTDFLRTKRQIIGGFIQALNSLEYIANEFTKYYYVGASLFDVLEIADSITIADINHARQYLSNSKQFSTITAFPIKKWCERIIFYYKLYSIQSPKRRKVLSFSNSFKISCLQSFKTVNFTLV